MEPKSQPKRNSRWPVSVRSAVACSVSVFVGMTAGIIIHAARGSGFAGFWYDELGVLGGIALINLVLRIGRVRHKSARSPATSLPVMDRTGGKVDPAPDSSADAEARAERVP